MSFISDKNPLVARWTGDKWELCEKLDPGARMFREIGNYNVTDLLNVLNFCFYLEQEKPGEMWGAVRIVDAIESLRKLLGFDEAGFEKLERIILGEIKSEDYAH